MKEYDHKKIESKWQKEWEKNNLYTAKDVGSGKKFYGLIEFPYPSGAGLHVGHIRSNTAMDIITRKRRMEGYNVLFPIGWDAFGLPTENYAIKTGRQPQIVTKENTDIFRKQLKQIGFGFDWSREVDTTDPAYYKWTQWIFLQLYKKGLAYKARTMINWCPQDKIGLANEEVVNGCCDRCGTPTVKKEKEQWMLAITKYADRLDADLDTVDYLSKIKIQQRNWIGKSEGSEIEFKITCERQPARNASHTEAGGDLTQKVKVFTTRADTLFSAFAIILAPEHALVQELKEQIDNWDAVEKYIDEIKKKTDIERTAEDKEKTGIELKGIKAINPINNEEIPIWIADFILVQYGTGAVFADMHDERDYAFGKKYNLPMRPSLEPVFERDVKEGLPFVERNTVSAIVKHWSEDKYLGLKWKKVNWGTFVTGGIEQGQSPEEAARAEIAEETGYTNLKLIKTLGRSHGKFYHVPKKENRFGHFNNFYFELLNGEQQEISKEEQEKHEVVWLNPDEVEKFLTAEGHRYDWNSLTDDSPVYTGKGILINSGKYNGLESDDAIKKITEAVDGKMVTKYKLRDWVFSRQRYWGEPIPIIHCESPARPDGRSGGCGYVPVPEEDLPVILPKVQSYIPTDTGESPLAIISEWVNTLCPKCGGKAKRETDTMPNWAGSSWYYLRYADPQNDKEFASEKNLEYFTPVDWYNGGMEHTTLHLLYSRFWHKFLFDLDLVPTSEPYMKRTSHGMILADGGVKMSKSIGNTVNPDDIVKAYGADTLRVYEMFMGPFDQAVVWNTQSIIGSRRFLEKVWKGVSYATDAKTQKTDNTLEKILHKTIKKVSEDIESMSFNTAISSMMMLSNEIEKSKKISVEDYKLYLQIVAPFAPHIAEELWEALGEKESIHLSEWPKFDPTKIIDATITIAIQVNGKVRAELSVPADINEEEVLKLAKENPSVVRFTDGKDIKKAIYVSGRLVNIVV